MNRSIGFLGLLLALIVLTATGLVLLIDMFDHILLVILIPLMFAIGAVPIALRVARGTFDLFEISVPYFAMYFLFFGAGSLFVLLVHGTTSDRHVVDYLDHAVALCTLGFACVMVGYWMGGRVVPVRRIGPGPRIGWVPLWCLYTAGLIGNYVSADIGTRSAHWLSITGLESLFAQLGFLSMLPFFYILYLMMSGQAEKSHYILFFAWMVPSTLVGLFLFFGNKIQLITTIALAFVAFWYAKRRVPWKSLTAFVLIVVFIVFPVYYTFRHYARVHYSRSDKIEHAFGELRKQDTNTYAENALTSVAKRFAIINATAVVIRDCGQRVDYQMGKTLWIGIVTLAIPRFLWPEKPTANIGQWFGRVFHITGFRDYSWITPTMAGELYWNFHIVGVIVGMFLLGFGMRALYLRFGAGGGADPLRLSIYVLLMFTLVESSEGGVGALGATLTRQIVILVLIEKALHLVYALVARRSSSQSVGSPGTELEFAL